MKAFLLVLGVVAITVLPGGWTSDASAQQRRNNGFGIGGCIDDGCNGSGGGSRPNGAPPSNLVGPQCQLYCNSNWVQRSKTWNTCMGYC